MEEPDDAKCSRPAHAGDTRARVCSALCRLLGTARQGLREALTLAELVADVDSGYVRAEVAREVRACVTSGLLRSRPASCRRDVAVRFAAVAQWCTATIDVCDRQTALPRPSTQRTIRSSAPMKLPTAPWRAPWRAAWRCFEISPRARPRRPPATCPVAPLLRLPALDAAHPFSRSRVAHTAPQLGAACLARGTRVRCY